MVDKVKAREELLQVVEKLNAELRLERTDVRLELASDERTEEMVDFLIKYFFSDETMCKSLGLEVDEATRQRLLLRYTDNLSLLLICNESNRIIGVRTIKVCSVNDQTINIDSIENEKIRSILIFLRHKSTEMNVYKFFCVDVAVHFINLAIHPDYRNKGLASLLVKSAIEFVRNIGLDSVCVTTEGTSNSSQKIYDRFGFHILHTVKYEDYKVNGDVVFKNTGANQSCKFYVKKL